MSNTIEDVLVQMHSGQWFGWSDPSNRVYENLVINGDYEKPTQEFLESELARLQAEYDSQEYARKREQEYPSIQECVHSILDDDLVALQAKRADVKARYPK
tara:strand:+ start:927 stop:1229 length:303 start_codon:yes stop_codon:yes gene_type:complete